jgi:hypothetical protein
MKRSIFVYALLAAAAAALGAQQASQSGPYQGTSNPPPDDTITTEAPEQAPPAKPSPYHYAAPTAKTAPAAQPAPPPYAAETVPNESLPAQANSAAASAPENGAAMAPAPVNGDGSDDGIVQVAPPESAGELGEGTQIRARLMGRLSTADSRPGEVFHARVASDVMQDGQVLIPAGSEIDGQVASVSMGRAGGHGSMRLRPETVILPDGQHFRLYAQLSDTLGSNTRVGYEGVVTPGSRWKKDSIEYGGAVGAGAVTGAILGGPGGALAGTIIGAGVISVHLLVSHPQATLDDGTVLLFTLSEPLNLVPAAASGN